MCLLGVMVVRVNVTGNHSNIWMLLIPQFSDKGTEAQRVYVTCPRSCSM